MTNRQRIITFMLLTLSILSLISCNRQTPAEKEAVYAKQVNELISTAIERLGESRYLIQSTLGTPSTTSIEQVKNSHDKKQTDQIHTLTYKGLVVRIYDVPSFKKEMLLSVRLTENCPSVLPELIGLSNKSIKSMFGAPRRVRGTVYEYVNELGAENVVNIEFDDSIVTAVEWIYYVD